ncbi:hypothetical protein [Neolewinella persica]|uniref:hypothetical protein n=1 Tax=Neolewinella persica TaxID=70998 RepID=UPI00036EF259|nr:hypothetical protein [Neolewinella persica]
MKNKKNVSILLLIIAITMSIAFFLNIEFLQGFELYFEREYYNQFGPLVISIELFIAGYYLFIEHQKANFALAIFGFTALFDLIFDQIGLFESLMPLYGTFILTICAILCLWIAFQNVFKLKRISFVAVIASFIFSGIIELFFNYF